MNPYANRHCEGCNASFSYWESIPTCKSCMREVCKDCMIPGSYEEDEGRESGCCKEPDCVDFWDDKKLAWKPDEIKVARAVAQCLDEIQAAHAECERAIQDNRRTQ